MKRYIASILIVLGLISLFAAYGPPARAQSTDKPFAALLVLDSAILPQSQNFLSRGIEQAVDEGAELIIVQLDTPGGLVETTRDMVSTIFSSEIPVVVYVAPAGARAASAGTFITASAHIAAMAPATNIGAASVVGSGGQELPETIKNKATEDTTALARFIAEERNRNAEILQSTVTEAKSFTAREALGNGIIDIIADDMDDLLVQIDGRTVNLERTSVTLETTGLEIRQINRNAVERFLDVVARPDVAFLLLTLGAFLIIIEFLNPGVILPGTFGAIALALGFLGAANLPLNWVGVGLIGLGMVLFFFELQAPGLGIFIVAGAISFIIGAFLLFGGISAPDLPGAPSFRVSLWMIGVVAAAMLASMFFLFRAMSEAKRAPRYFLGGGSLVGKVGIAKTVINPHGTVQIAGELWSAASDDGEQIEEGEEVIVLEEEGLTLKVFKAHEQATNE